jgi:hypothetical protein
MLTKGNKMLVGIYRRAAGLDEAEYRQILQSHAGCVSTTADDFTQSSFDRVMAALERQLFLRVDHGDVPDPIGQSSHILRRDYWQGKLARTQAGQCTTRQQYKIRELWDLLAPELGYKDPEQDPAGIAYLQGVIHHATGKKRIGQDPLTSAEAAAVIDALQDRLKHLPVTTPGETFSQFAGKEVPAEKLSGANRLN